jgi:hypothetical protein
VILKRAAAGYERLINGSKSKRREGETVIYGLLFLLFFQQNVSGTVTVTMTATDPAVLGQTTSGIASVQCFIDGQPLSQLFTAPTTPPNSYSFPWNTTLYANGGHMLLAKAIDNAGNVGTASLAVNISNVAPPDTTPPVIQFVTPIAGATVSGKINVNAMATDNTAVSQMKLFIRNQLRASTLNGSLLYNWNTAPDKKFSPVPLTVTATDPNGNQSSETHTVTIH